MIRPEEARCETCGAEISDCGRYRTMLWRKWRPELVSLPFLMLNPSTADATVDDPTIRRCKGFAAREGYGGIIVVNMYSYRATKPSDLFVADDPFGPNWAPLEYVADYSAAHRVPVVAAWGAHRIDEDVWGWAEEIFRHTDMRCLGRTKAGLPRHPLYVPANQPLEPWSFCGEHPAFAKLRTPTPKGAPDEQ